MKAVLVTGSATGTGRACAVRFARLGYAVDRTEPFLGGTAVHMRKRLGASLGRTSAG